MERDNLHTDLKTKLENRKIVPSDRAWSMLEAQLDAHTPPKKRNRTLYYAMAASIVLLIISNIYFANQNTDKTLDSITDTEKSPQETLPTQKEAVADQATPPIQDDIVIVTPVDKKKRSPRKKTTGIAPHTAPENAVVETTTDSINPGNALAETQENTIENNAANAEVDALLAQARERIATVKAQTDTLSKTDAMALLADVEDELDRSFKDKVLETIMESFQKVKTAVAERNQ